MATLFVNTKLSVVVVSSNLYKAGKTLWKTTDINYLTVIVSSILYEEGETFATTIVINYLRVVIVSSKLYEAGETVATMMVFAFPPNESWSRRVSFESR